MLAENMFFSEKVTYFCYKISFDSADIIFIEVPFVKAVCLFFNLRF